VRTDELEGKGVLLKDVFDAESAFQRVPNLLPTKIIILRGGAELVSDVEPDGKVGYVLAELDALLCVKVNLGGVILSKFGKVRIELMVKQTINVPGRYCG
jgi:hypothetical protein